ncbi:hypothetical protein ACH3O9_10245 [Leeuwenhoekiella sp. A16]|uniref:hypothetical protein n=1 Tax=unclassified Leeuwenhoekiella TaxID=2615029 RepID=UPI003A80C474
MRSILNSIFILIFLLSSGLNFAAVATISLKAKTAPTLAYQETPYKSISELKTRPQSLKSAQSDEIYAAKDNSSYHDESLETFKNVGLDIEAFGAVGNDDQNDQIAWNAAVKAAKKGNRTVIIPPKKFILDSVVIYSDVNYVGLSEHESVLEAADSDLDWFVRLDNGPVQRLQISNLTFQGIGERNSGQKGLYLSASESDYYPYHGGMWYSTFSYITVKGFDSSPLYMQAQLGLRNGDLVNQFISFNQCHFFRSAGQNNAVTVIGKNGQMDFNNVVVEGQLSSWMTGKENKSTDIYIGREFKNGEPLTDTTPYTLHFNLLTVQNADLGVEIDRAQNVHISGYFENLHRGIKIVNSASNITVDQVRFANSASDGKDTGYGVYVNNSSASITNNYFCGAHDFIIWGVNHNGISQFNNTGSGKLKTKGITQQMAIAADGSLNIKNLTSVMVNTGDKELSIISSKHMTGSEITIVALGNGTLTINDKGNIDIPGGKLVLSSKEVATFKKFDLSSEWLLVNTTNR